MPTRNLDAEFDAFARKAYGLTGNTLLAKLKKGESGGRHDAVSDAGARGEYQFMPATRDAVRRLTGGRVDPYRSEAEGREAAMLHLLGKLGHKRGLGGYNPGGGKQYVRYILGQQVDGEQRVSKSGARDSSPGTSRTVESSRTIPGVDRSDERRQVILRFLQERHRPGAVADLASGLKETRDTPSVRATSSRTVKDSSSASTGGKRSPLLELFYNGPGGVNVKNGQRQPKGFVSGHTDHVHVAAGPKTVVQIGHLAQRMGLNVTENPAFDPVDPVHVKGSYHYRKQAIDVSGDPARMREFNRRVARSYGIGR